jgi:hypothetical protein
MSPSYIPTPTLKDNIESSILTEAGVGKTLPQDSTVLLHLIAVTGHATTICHELQRSAVNQARRHDISWAEIGQTLEISRQAAQQRFVSEKAAAPAADLRIIRGVTAFSEMSILESEGKAGYHLTGFGALTLQLKPSSQVWLHKRVTALYIGKIRKQMETKGWTYVGAWFPFHYFKKTLA